MQIDIGVSLCSFVGDAGQGRPDLVIERNLTLSVGEVHAASDLLATASDGSRRHLIARRSDGGVDVHVPAVLDARVDALGRRVEVRPHPAVGAAVLTQVTTKLLVTIALLVRGEQLVHASAAERDGVALAIAGPAGAGKSTLAGYLCASGGRLLADDQLRVASDDQVGTRCWRSADELRMRTAGLGPSLVATLGLAGRSGDDRMLVRPPVSLLDSCRLGAVVVPIPADIEQLALVRLGVLDAARVLGRAAALPGQLAGEWQRRAFHQAVSMAERVPVWAARLPWRAEALPTASARLWSLVGDVDPQGHPAGPD